jgi:hypothetical protein
MVNSTEPEIAAGDADSNESAPPSDAVPDSIPEVSADMLDVHAPHGVHTWKDFFIHLGTIAVGLLIAIGLEQSVEALHHRHQVNETRSALQEEHRENIKRFHSNVRSHLVALALLHNNLRALMYLRDHPQTPEAGLPGAVTWSLFAQEPLKAAWSTAESTDIVALMPAAEVRSLTMDYSQLDYAWRLYQPVIAELARCTSYQTHTSDVTTLSAAELAELIDCTEHAQALETVYGDGLSVVGSNKDYAPVPDWWRMIPFFQMQESVARAKTNTEAFAQTARDVDAALAADPAGPAKDLSCAASVNGQLAAVECLFRK